MARRRAADELARDPMPAAAYAAEFEQLIGALNVRQRPVPDETTPKRTAPSCCASRAAKRSTCISSLTRIPWVTSHRGVNRLARKQVPLGFGEVSPWSTVSPRRRRTRSAPALAIPTSLRLLPVKCDLTEKPGGSTEKEW